MQPTLPNLDVAFLLFDYAAVLVFGASGALAAARRGHDIVTFAFFAAMTGVGGGTLRDLLIGAPVFWINSPGYLLTSIIAAIIVWLVGRRTWRLSALLWLDAVGMAAYCIVGAAKALALGVHPVSAVVMGMMTACFGGVLRDVVAGEPSILLQREIYVTATILGAAVFVVLAVLGVDRILAGGIGFAAAFALRGAAIRWKLGLPGFHGREPPPER
ncbi:MAG: trimeric intracellular cation channel family protein [Caulobacteraceae bacterium]|nr:MAG: trimeric intracellular cation channel family protein [Caulobacteraceae bacterium]